jgi:thioredoxin reductase (NADPH)
MTSGTFPSISELEPHQLFSRLDVPDMLDCLIIGGGPAGLTAAIYLARYRRDACLIDADQSRALLIPETHNYPGFAGISGPALLERLRDQAEANGARLHSGFVRSLTRKDGAFVAATADTEIAAKTVILATGLVDECPPIEGFAHDQYCGPVRFCPICVGIMGDMEAASGKALFMRTYTPDILLFPTGTDGTAAPIEQELRERGIVFAGKPQRIERLDQTVAVTTEDGARHVLDVLYPALGCKVNSGLALSVGASCDDIGMIRVDAHQRTNVQGLYAAGDVVTDLHQIAVATAHAAVAATHVHNSLPRNPR